MQYFDTSDLKQLYMPSPQSHKGQNGKLMVIGGSVLFHAASLWALEIASRIVDMVFYSSVNQNNEIVERLKEEWRSGIIVPRDRIDQYIEEADAILIGPGLPRETGLEEGDDDTLELTKRLLTKYSNKKWIVDGGSLQVIDPKILPKNSIVTPHHLEFEKLFATQGTPETVGEMSKKYGVVILLKGQEDIVCSPEGECVVVKGGNAGMTKGGTGDVLAGLVAALSTKNDNFLSAKCGSFFNKKAGEALAKKVGLYFNASDLAHEIPGVMGEWFKGKI